MNYLERWEVLQLLWDWVINSIWDWGIIPLGLGDQFHLGLGDNSILDLSGQWDGSTQPRQLLLPRGGHCCCTERLTRGSFRFKCGTPANPSQSRSGLLSFLIFPKIHQKSGSQTTSFLIVLRAAPRATQISSPGASRHQNRAD